MRHLAALLHAFRCTLVLAAHPADETIGAGALIARAPEAVQNGVILVLVNAE